MKNFVLAFRTLTKKGYNSGIKILSLGVGLSIGLFMVAKACFEVSYNNFYPDLDRLIYVTSASSMDDDRYHPICGGVGGGMAIEIPEVEVSTRYKLLAYNSVFFTQERKRLESDVIIADSCFFDVLSRPIVVGNAKQVLSQPQYVMVSRTIAQNISGTDASAAIGQIIRLDKYPDVDLVVGGVFEDIPENTTEIFDMVISMESIGQFGYDGSQRWRGDNEFHTFAKLYPDADRTNLDKEINDMVARHLDKDIVEKTGVTIYFWSYPLKGKRTDDVGVRSLITILILFAVIVMFVAVMNYILVVLSTIISRSKEVAVRKCFGAEKKNISAMMFSETFIHLLFALILAIVIIFAFRNSIQSLFMNRLTSLITPISLVVLVGVVLLVFFVSAYIPSHLYGNIPVAVAFRNYTKSRRRWKLVLLFCQFTCTAFLFTLLVVFLLQYSKVENEDVGYDTSNIVMCDVQGVPQVDRENTLQELRRLPFVNNVATCSAVPCTGSWGGNDVMLVGSEYQIFQVDDFYAADENTLPLLGIKIVDGSNFVKGATSDNEILVSEKFAVMMERTAGWKGSIVGREVFISSHGICRIKGVYSEIRFGESGTGRYSDWPSIFSYSKETSQSMLVKMTDMSKENVAQVHDVMHRMMPEKDIFLVPYDQALILNYTEVDLFKKMVVVCASVSLLLAVIGLIGYVNDEINRRRKELAIRRISGASINSILKLFHTDLLKMSLPAITLGGLIAYFMSVIVVSVFRDKISLSFLLFMCCGIFVLLIITAITIANTWRAAQENPVKNLKSE